jgi:Zn-dependent protease with chaperone function
VGHRLFALSIVLLLGVNTSAQEPPQNSRPRSPEGVGKSFEGAFVLEEKAAPVAVPEPTERAIHYYQSGNALWLIGTEWSILIPCLFLFTGLSARLRTWAQCLGRRWFFVIAIYFILFSVLNYLIDFPLSYYRGYVRPHAYDLSNQIFGKWFADSLLSLMVNLVAGCLFLWVPYLLLKKSPKRWWLYTSILAVPFLFFVTLIAPIWIDPLFNKFGEMENKNLEAKILALASRAGIEGSRVYEVKKSEDTKTLNAYVTGVGQTKRIVLWDTLLAKFNDREVLCVMGHEMGHYVLGHVLQGILLGSLLVLVTLYVAHRTLGLLLRRFHQRFGFDTLADVASLPLLILFVNVLGLVVNPVVLAYTRHVEHEADRFGLEITKDNHAAATAFVKMQATNLSFPRPGLLHKLWRSSHPSLGERVDFCNEYRPWEKGQPLVYGHLFRENKSPSGGR